MLGGKGARAEEKASGELAALNAVQLMELVLLIAGEEGGTRGVAVNCIDITKNPECEGSLQAR